LYRLRFSKTYDEDIDSCYDYIKDTLIAPMAAENLIIEMLKN